MKSSKSPRSHATNGGDGDTPQGIPTGVTLRAVLEGLGPTAAQPIGHPDFGRIVFGTEFHDALESFPEVPEIVLLVPIATPFVVGDSHRLAMIERIAMTASSMGISALALKCLDEEVEMVADISQRHALPFMRVSEQMNWRFFDALLGQILGERQHNEDAHRDPITEPLFGLANQLAEFFGGSVAIEDLGRRIIAYSAVPGQLIDPLRMQGILTRQVPASPFNDDQYRTVLRSTEPVKYPRLDDEEPRVAVAIRAGSLPLGTIWVIDASGEPTLTGEQRQTITEAASLASTFMLDDIRVRNATQLPREDRLRALLDGYSISGYELAEIGISEERGATLLVFAPLVKSHAALLAQLKSAVQRHLTPHRPETVAVTRGDFVFAMIGKDHLQQTVALVSSLLPLIDRLIEPGTVIAIPGSGHQSRDFAELRQLSERMVSVAGKLREEKSSTGQSRVNETDEQRVFTLEDLRSSLVFDRVAQMYSEAPELSNPTLVRMRNDDPDYAATLSAWCGAFGNVALTARRLKIHENTVRYRLRQVDEKYGIVLKDPDQLLETWLQLRVESHSKP